MRKYFIGFLFGVTVSFSAAAYASETLQVLKSNVTLMYKDKDIDLKQEGFEVFNYNGNNYVSLRVIAETLKLPIWFDEFRNEIVLGSFRLDDTLELTELLNNNFEGIQSIAVQYGDGSKIEVKDQNEIHTIAEKLKQVKLKISENQEPTFGYLYSLTIKTKDAEIVYPSNLHINGDLFRANSQTKELDSLVMSLKLQ
ncbi:MULTISPECIES: hypothetical protein [Paenibacillus]|uniref:hypothetical protein n=1 Tax=Paenibacillus TaxID=44249 RepID=UPI0022B87CC1|nr:hypothetical protein [Paenibacillus caseinilyticus]MCZ8518270.1 hypothetical protein [Paenibacillus caseinilyticus]